MDQNGAFCFWIAKICDNPLRKILSNPRGWTTNSDLMASFHWSMQTHGANETQTHLKGILVGFPRFYPGFKETQHTSFVTHPRLTGYPLTYSAALVGSLRPGKPVPQWTLPTVLPFETTDQWEGLDIPKIKQVTLGFDTWTPDILCSFFLVSYFVFIHPKRWFKVIPAQKRWPYQLERPEGQ